MKYDFDKLIVEKKIILIPSKISFPADVLETRPSKMKYSRIIVFVQLNGRNTHFDKFVFQLNFDDSTKDSNSFAIS